MIMHSFRKLFLPFTVLLLLAVLYFFYDPAKQSFFPKCPFYRITGLYCPGCGSQRALHSLLHGAIPEAASFNLLMIASLPLLLHYYFVQGWNALSQKQLRTTKLVHNTRFIYTVLILVLAFWWLRNTDTAAGRYLAP